MQILAIETSCDDTCIAILKIENYELKILSNIVSSQVKLHAKYEGVYPALAKREHQKNLPIVLKKALKKARNPKIDLIAVTIGPGLEPCLWQGVNFAKNLSVKLKKPLIPVNHIEAHILANFVRENSKFEGYPTGSKQRNSKFRFPAICLVVSGGHTQLILMKNFGKYKILGETRDDAAGECLDKVARILGLGYPGGPAIAAEAAKFEIRNPKFEISLPRPMIYQKNYDFSFSGLKTAVLYDFKSRSLKVRKSKKYIQEMAAEGSSASSHRCFN
jgi:N6-L-threonylcarbamoyladenine synthase